MERRKFILTIGGIESTGAAVGSGTFSSVEASRDVSVSVVDDAWHHVVMTFESGDAVRLYLDGIGVEETPVAADDTLVSRFSQAALGAPAQLNGLFFEGRIDDTRI